MNYKWEKIGEISVDAGIVWLGDPCYILGEDPSYKPGTWHQFVDMLSEMETNGVVNIEDGTGIVVSSGYGDGSYPVYVKRDEDGIILEVKIDFEQKDEDENDR